MKTARSIAASPAMSRKFEKKLLTFVNSFRRRVINEILLYIDQENLLAEDVSLTFRPDDPIDRERLRQIKRKINRLVLRDPERFKRNIDEFYCSQHDVMVTRSGQRNAEDRRLVCT